MQKLSAHPTIVCHKASFINFWVFFGYVWEEIVFLKELVNLGKNKKFGRFNVVLKLEVEVKISRRTPRQSPTNLGVLLRGGELSVGVSKLFLFLLYAL